jgi:beta-mannanase
MIHIKDFYQRADAIKAWGSPIYLAFHHEPENDTATFGTPAEYAAAFRRVVEVFRSRGVTNVAFVWTLMAWSYDPRSGRDPNQYYPGDAHVGAIGADGHTGTRQGQ